MASALTRGNSVPDPVKERRLRPLYDLLDAGNCKKVLQEADKLLKKCPDFTCAKVFKALAYMRLGKIEECLNIMDVVYSEGPTDNSALHAMSICYRELDMPHKVCGAYEIACKKDKSEDNMTCWFMANVRVCDFANQHKVALQLYKQFGKGAYLLWAVMSLFVKATLLDERRIADTITLPLARRMLEKYLEETPVYVEEDLILYVLVLFRVGDYETAMAVLKKNRSRWNPERYLHLEMKCVKHLGDEDAILEAMEKYILYDSENYESYCDYVTRFGAQKTDRVVKLCMEIVDRGAHAKVRAAVLALLTLRHKVASAETAVSTRKLLVEYFKRFATRPFLNRDLKSTLQYMRSNNMVELINSIGDDMKEHDGQPSRLAMKLQFETNYECLQYCLNEEKILSDPANVMDFVSRFMEIFKTAQNKFTLEGCREDIRDVCPYEDILITAIKALMKTFWNKMGFWTGYYLASDTARTQLKDSTKKEHVKENGKIFNKRSYPKYEWFEGEFPIVLAIVLAEDGVRSSPYCHAYRILLSKLYFFSGATFDALANFMKLDIKYMQIESMGYMYLPKALTGGVITDAVRVLNQAEAFYANCTRENMEHVISAYKYSSWAQVIEFLNFRQTVIHSLQAMAVRVDKGLFDFTSEGNSREQIMKIAQRHGFDTDAVFTKEYDDTRDFTIHSFLYDEETSPEIRELTAKDTKERLKFRSAILGILCTSANVLEFIEKPTICTERVEKLKFFYEKLTHCLENPVEACQDKLENRVLTGPWPPTSFEYACSGMICTLQEMAGLLLVAWSDSTGKDPSNFYDWIGVLGNKIKQVVDLFISQWGKVDISLINMGNVNEEIFLVVETLGFLCVLVDVLKGMMEKTSEVIPVEGKGKRKKSKEKEIIVLPWALSYNSLVKDVLACLTVVEDKLTKLGKECLGWFPPKWTEQHELFWKGKVSGIVLSIVKTNLPDVALKLGNSYSRAYSDMKGVVRLKRQYTESLLIPQ